MSNETTARLAVQFEADVTFSLNDFPVTRNLRSGELQDTGHFERLEFHERPVPTLSRLRFTIASGIDGVRPFHFSFPKATPRHSSPAAELGLCTPIRVHGSPKSTTLRRVATTGNSELRPFGEKSHRRWNAKFCAGCWSIANRDWKDDAEASGNVRTTRIPRRMAGSQYGWGAETSSTRGSFCASSRSLTTRLAPNGEQEASVKRARTRNPYQVNV